MLYLECKMKDGVQGVFSSNQLNIASVGHQMGDTHLPSGGQK